jgi:hypothetical protein
MRGDCKTKFAPDLDKWNKISKKVEKIGQIRKKGMKKQKERN